MLKLRILGNDVQIINPFLMEEDFFLQRSIKFCKNNNESYDLTLITHNLFQDKKLGSFEASLEKGLKFLEKIDGPFILVDGQDSHSLIGTYETFIQSKALCLLKLCLLKNKDLYQNSYVGGRLYWGTSEDHGVAGQNYKAIGVEKHLENIHLLGTNWLGVQKFPWYDYKNITKLFNVSAMFGYPHPPCEEFDIQPSQDYYYNSHRTPVIEKINKSPYMISKLVKGKRVDMQKYMQYVSCSQILLAPFGYGEIAPRDLESAQYGSILLKPDMSHLETSPNIYKENETYLPCRHDYSDLEEKIDFALNNFNELRDFYVENMRKEYNNKYYPGYFAENFTKLLAKLNIL
tara:strand:+ start:3223 stop:4260 length:1038 start_codon:yes stop_codon:yes gene_type:complete